MATVITNTKVDEFVWNKLYIRIYDIILAVYATNGYTAALGFSPSQYGLKIILGMSQIGEDAAADLIVRVSFDITNTKLLAYRGGTFTPAGTNSTSTVSGNFVVVGGGIGEATGINPDTNAGVLSKAAATNRTIPIATYAGATWTAAAQTFTGTAQGQQSFAEVSNAVDLSAVKVRCMIFGR